ncbi:hypothetical protein K6119_02285 [Paracrocinitomix mangrovi]|uniref:DUF6134 family protein n=1 Tax=Paracrocinitomix mangrovi TaxID=2862509 RepID=UPI001C8F16C4|nr:DUF6134 family protein [Paracrocinitomix mangrovi]UKN02348.1 hypothetical protein K6119_02285 [Paracrocinitomix mangrovi]
MKKLILLLSICTLSVSYAAFTDFNMFDHRNRLIGILTVEHTEKDSIASVQIKSEFFIRKWPKKWNVSEDLNSIYHNGKLHKSDLMIYKNGQMEKSVSTFKKGAQYAFNKNGIPRNIDPVGFTESMLFIKEPKGVTEVYSEHDGLKYPLSLEGEGLYQMKETIMGKIYEFEYEDGKLMKATLFYKLLQIYIRRK